MDQVAHREQVLEGCGWKMLPGLYPTGKSLELDVSYKVIIAYSALIMSWPGGHRAWMQQYGLLWLLIVAYAD